MSWGVRLAGFNSVMNALEELTIDLTDDAVYVVGSDVEYAVYQELGTVHMEANPFLRPAVNDARRQLDRFVARADSSEDLIKRIALHIEKRAKHYATTGVPPGPDVQTGTLRASIRAERVA